jgi:hypothetical protein
LCYRSHSVCCKVTLSIKGSDPGDRKEFPMDFDLDEGLYIFEITLGYQVGDSEYMTVPFILRADDSDEAEEIVQDYLELNQLANSFWIVEISDTFDPEEYQTLVDEGERERWDRLEDYSAEDFLEILHSDDMELL